MSCFICLFVCLWQSHKHPSISLSLWETVGIYLLQLVFQYVKLSSRMKNKKDPSFCSRHVCLVDSDLHGRDAILYSPVLFTCIVHLYCSPLFNSVIHIFVFICSTSKSNLTLELSWLRWKRGLRTTGLTSTTILWWHYESLWSTEETLLKKSVTLSTFSRELSREHAYSKH